LHEPGEIDLSRSLRGDIENLLNDAIGQNPGGCPFIIFVDLNVPTISGIPVTERAWFQDIWASMQSMGASNPANPDEVNAYFFTNFSYHWDGRKTAPGGEHLHIIPQHSKYAITPGILARIIAAIHSYGSIPKEI
jgi:hypothetical protein